MPGPIGKHPSLRSRRSRAAGFRTLKPVADVVAPAWPLSGDAAQVVELEALRDKVAAAQAAVAAFEGVGRGLSSTERSRLLRARRALDRDQLALAVLEVQMQQRADAEAEFWADLWRAPQAAIWAENPASWRELAHYVRWALRAADGDHKASAEARQLSDRLGINPAALLRLRAEVEHVDAAEDRGRRRRERATPVEPPQTNADPKPDLDPRRGLYAVPDPPDGRT